MATAPKIQVDTMPADKFFACAAELLKVNPPHITDQPIIAQMKRYLVTQAKGHISTINICLRNVDC
jgi:hypothetical protein